MCAMSQVITMDLQELIVLGDEFVIMTRLTTGI